MFDALTEPFRKGVEKIRSNPQLLYTALVALLIVGAFLFMAERFVSIANSAQERLINVRAGSIQDAFTSFAGDRLNDTAYLNKKIAETIAANETIRSFQVIVKKDIPGPASTTVSGARVIVASNKPEELNQVDANDAFLFALAEADTSHSVTIQETAGSERLFRTVRAITDDGGSVIGIALTSQTLSEADRAIERDIRNSFFLLVGVLVVIMLLFLRHSKIIDYMALYKKLQEVDQLKDDFISMASHELRTPLTVIRGYSEYIREAPGLTPETKEYAQKIDVSVQGLDSLVADILDVSRIDQGRMSFTFEKFNPEEVVREIADQLAVTAKEKGLTLSCAIETGSDAFITADKSRLKQVLVNIVGNAVKYTVKGEVKIRLYAEKNRVVIRVSDTGLGMSEEERAHLFEKFFRIKTKETENIRGTGLGLWITKQMVEEMKGSISVESIKGVGSHFIVSFPIVG